MNIVDTLGFSYTDRLAPVALLLRSGEAVDAGGRSVAVCH